MGKLLAYLIVSGMILLAMYLVYKLFIAKENQHAFNRGILLATYIVAFSAYPLYDLFNSLSVNSLPETTTIDITIVENLTSDTPAQPKWGTILIWCFLFGATVVAIKTVITWLRIVRVVRSGKKIKYVDFTLVIIDNDNIAPFSWLHYVVINSNDFDNKNSAIIEHELKHIRSFHWIDLIIAQLVCIFNWFNPAAWLMRDELMLVHEYQADMAVIDSGHDPQEYQILLIKKAVGSRFPSLANSINHSKLKKRITMMYKSKSGAGSKLKSLALVPMVALALGVANVPQVKATVSTISNSEVSIDKGKENSLDSSQFKIASLNNSGIETTVVVIGEDMGNYVTVSDATFTNKGRNYHAKSQKTTMKDGSATITATFPVSENYENASFSFRINGENIKINLDDFRRNQQTNKITISPSKGIVISEGNAIVSSVGNMEIYLDGKKISEDEMKALNPETIATIAIDKQKNTIRLTTKKQ